MLTIAHESAPSNPYRTWATLTSFMLQAAGAAVVLLIPLLRPSVLPHLDLTPHMVPIFLPHVQMPEAPQISSGPSAPSTGANLFVVPREIPKGIRTDSDPAAATNVEAPCAQCIGVTGSGPVTGNIPMIGLALAPVPPTVARPARISRIMDGSLIHRVQPDYPILAKQSRIQGPVQIAALISRTGTIENLQVVSGHPMLVSAALNAVKQWRYRPYILNGEPIEVETKITVIFSLGGG
jgi:protein TonB